jgi:hypothetical protein
MTKQFNFAVSVLIAREDDAWVAQCLEFDIAAQGSSVALAKENFEKTFVGQIVADISVGKDPLEGIAQAPRFYWSKFDQGERLADRKPFYLGESVPPAYMIQAAATELRLAE